MTKTIFAPIAALAALTLVSACGGTEEPAPVETTAAVATPDPVNSIDAPTSERVTELVAEACPDFEPVGKAQCLSAGMGSNAFNCEFALGDDEYMRNDAKLVLGEGDQWVLEDSEKVCTQGS